MCSAGCVLVKGALKPAARKAPRMLCAHMRVARACSSGAISAERQPSEAYGSLLRVNWAFCQLLLHPKSQMCSRGPIMHSRRGLFVATGLGSPTALAPVVEALSPLQRLPHA